MAECTDARLRDWIHHYELNQLDDADRDRFEEHLFECVFCLKEVTEMQPLSAVLSGNREAMLHLLQEDGLTFDRIRRRITDRRPTIPDRLAALFSRWQVRTALAGAVLTIFLAILLPQWTQDRYRPYLSYELPPHETAYRLRGEGESEATTVFQAAMEFYSRQNYTAAVQGIRNALRLDPNPPERWLYLGASQYALRDARAAIRSLKRADENGQGLTRIHARWYLAQSYLYLGKRRPALPLLEWVVAEQGVHAADALALLTRIRQSP